MARTGDRIDRRHWLAGATAAGLSLAAARAFGLASTPRQTTDPFYPYDDALESDANLVQVGGVGGCEKPRINGEHKIWGLTSGDDVFSQIGRLVAGSSLPAMNTRCVRTLGRVTRRAGAQRRSREEA